MIATKIIGIIFSFVGLYINFGGIEAGHLRAYEKMLCLVIGTGAIFFGWLLFGAKRCESREGKDDSNKG